ncbi:type I pullulanase [Marinicrinis sediminis]|uniref:Type I pullulanase n=1 Tax=Marinicrinis sediminis TaxID=1652465 RepID=A0ABW5R869_9BACL
MAVQRELDFEISFGDAEFVNGAAIHSTEFEENWTYDGDDLGLQYSPEASRFHVWAPTASKAVVVLYRTWDGKAIKEIAMNRTEKGVWRTEVQGDLEGWLYTYKVWVGTDVNEAVDPYAKAVAVNGDRAAIVDMGKTNPEHWETEAAKPAFVHPVDAVIYEVHVRDLTIHPHSGAVHKGTFKGFSEPGTRSAAGHLTGLDHIADLGVTHVQLMPSYDYSTESVDETRPWERYNWGYDPKNYNVPEGSYATDPYDPVCRIKEMKEMIQAIHHRGMRVIMDVVYNHLYDGYRANLMKLVPGYYFRYEKDAFGEVFANGSGCGNDTASERKMMRKLMVDSIVYWAREYQIDGFRFDLMGLHDVETMNEIRRRLDEIDTSLLMTGEGWNLDTNLPAEAKANQMNARQMPRIAQFNDDIRNAIKGSIFYEDEKGFVNGQPDLETRIKMGVVGGIAYRDDLRTFASEPDQNLNYVECHDNHTLWDKLCLTHPEESEIVLRRMHRLASSIILTSQGLAFLHAGQEFMRTKNGVENSFRSPDAINQMDWDRCDQFQEDVSFVKQWIRLRRDHAAFRLRTAEDIRQHLHIEESPAGTVVFTLRDHANGDDCRHLCVIYNANHDQIKLQIPSLGEWKLLKSSFDTKSLEIQTDGSVTVPAIEAIVLGC